MNQVPRAEPADAPASADKPGPAERRLKGLAVSNGRVAGPAVVLSRAADSEAVREFSIPPGRVSFELARFAQAKKETRRQIEMLNDELAASARAKDAAIFEGHAMLLDDELLNEDIKTRISSGLMNAEAAVFRSIKDFRAVFDRMSDRYMRERAADLDDLCKRLISNLCGDGGSRLDTINEPSIIVADDLSPSETVSFPKGLLLGFATMRGSVTSHVALLARSLGIPAVAGLGAALQNVRPGETVVLDGDSGELVLSPSPETVASVKNAAPAAATLAAAPQTIGPAALPGGRNIYIFANAHEGVPLSDIADSGACGVGLYRSEYLWLREGRDPTEDEQTVAYARMAGYIATAVYPGGPTVIRILDLGGDKLMPGASQQESNPFLGNRSIRFLLSHRAFMRTQLRAVLRASAQAPVAVMYPMIATLDELRAANAELRHAMTQLAFAGIPFDANIKRGAMIELPSAALNAAAIAAEADFLSIGTNDLIQYTLGADRGNDAVAYLYQPMNPAVLKLVDMTFRAANSASIPAAVCGESASDPVMAAVWTALGASGLSMSCGYVPTIRRALCALVPGAFDALAAELRARWDGATASEMREFARSFLASHVSHPEDAAIFSPSAE